MNGEILAQLETVFPPSVDQTHGDLLPCPCGGGRPDAGTVFDGQVFGSHFVQCACGRSAQSDTADGAALRWNAAARAGKRGAA